MSNRFKIFRLKETNFYSHWVVHMHSIDWIFVYWIDDSLKKKMPFLAHTFNIQQYYDQLRLNEDHIYNVQGIAIIVRSSFEEEKKRCSTFNCLSLSYFLHYSIEFIYYNETLCAAISIRIYISIHLKNSGLNLWLERELQINNQSFMSKE